MRWLAQVCGLLLLLAGPAACARGEGEFNGSAHSRRQTSRTESRGRRSARRVHAHGHIQYHGHQAAKNTTVSAAAAHLPPGEEEREQLNAETQEEETQLQKIEEETEYRAEESARLAKEEAKRRQASAKEEAFQRFQAVQRELCTAIQDVTDLPEQSNKTHCPDVQQRKEEAEQAKEEVMRIKGQLKAALVQLASAEAAVASEEILLAEVRAKEVEDQAKASAQKEKKVIRKLRETVHTTVTVWSNHSYEDAGLELAEVSNSEEDKYLGTWCFVNKDAVEKLEVVRTKKLEGNIRRPNEPDIPYMICVCGHIATKVHGKWVKNGTVNGYGNLVWNHTTDSDVWFRPDKSDKCSKKRAVQAIEEGIPEDDMREESLEQAALLGAKGGAPSPGRSLAGAALALVALSWGSWRV